MNKQLLQLYEALKAVQWQKTGALWWCPSCNVTHYLHDDDLSKLYHLEYCELAAALKAAEADT